jgi:hypothetical protein
MIFEVLFLEFPTPSPLTALDFAGPATTLTLGRDTVVGTRKNVSCGIRKQGFVNL